MQFWARSWCGPKERLMVFRNRLVCLMSDSLPPPPHTRIYINAPPFLRALGCSGCSLGCMVLLFVVFVLGGLFGILMFGWKTLLGF